MPTPVPPGPYPASCLRAGAPAHTTPARAAPPSRRGEWRTVVVGMRSQGIPVNSWMVALPSRRAPKNRAPKIVPRGAFRAGIDTVMPATMTAIMVAGPSIRAFHAKLGPLAAALRAKRGVVGFQNHSADHDRGQRGEQRFGDGPDLHTTESSSRRRNVRAATLSQVASLPRSKPASSAGETVRRTPFTAGRPRWSVVQESCTVSWTGSCGITAGSSKMRMRALGQRRRRLSPCWGKPAGKSPRLFPWGPLR